MATTQPERAPRAPFAPDEAWIDAFAQQNTRELREAAKRYAARRARGIGKAGAHVDELDLRALVQDALTDTLLGQVGWDPATTTLEQHLFDTIRYRTRHARERARRYAHQRVDVFDARAAGTSSMGELESSMRLDREAASPEDLVFAGEVIARLRERAAGDAMVLRLLDAIAEGAAEPREIMAVGKLSKKQYRNAHERLDRLIRSMDHALDEDLRS